ncbi:MAG: LemA family protein [Syntrophaceae bacterium]|nr:LemA family protein [Syntrophaceae bacterium]
MIPFIVIVVIIAVIVFYFVGIYNKLVALRNRYLNAFKQIDVQLKRRYDLIPNLVESTKGYLAHERGTLDEVIKARNNAFSASNVAAANPGNADAMNGLTKAEGILGGAMGKFIAVVESYPDLKANQTISQLMEEITTTENRISFARQAYNDIVAEYNTNREQFPNSIIANSFNFTAANLLEVMESPEERKAPKVSFQ